MNSTSFRALLAPAICGLLLSSAAAQPPEKPRTDLGAPGEEHRTLDGLAGSWQVTVKIPVAPGQHAEGQSTCEANWVLDGRFLRQEYSSTFMGKPLTIVRYLGFDRHKGKFVEVQLESTHTDVMHTEGALSADGRTITCLGMHVDAALGREVHVRTVTTLLHRDAFTLEIFYAGTEGKEAKTITLTHKRKQAP